MGLIIADLLGKTDRYIGLIKNITEPFYDNGKVVNLNMEQVNKQLSKISIEEESLKRDDINRLKNNVNVKQINGVFFNENNEKLVMKLTQIKKPITKND